MAPGDDGSSDWPEILTAREVAAYLRIHYTVVLRLTRKGELPAFRAGRTWRYKRALLDAQLAGRHQVEETGDAGSEDE